MRKTDINKILSWRDHSMDNGERKNLEESDRFWQGIYSSETNLRVKKGVLLFRVHSGNYSEPLLEEYDDMGDNYEEIYNEEHQKWLDSQDINKIRWTNNWLSFTINPDVIGSNYFSQKNLRGFVIVTKANKGVHISDFISTGFNEFEVVAPMDKSTLIEILEFNDFMDNYGTGNSDYERENNYKKT